MAEIKILICDVCGNELKDGAVLTHSNRRRIEDGVARKEAFRFDICDRCFGRIKRECRAEKERQRRGIA